MNFEYEDTLYHRIHSRELRLKYEFNRHQVRWLDALSSPSRQISPEPNFVDTKSRLSTLGVLMYNMGGVPVCDLPEVQMPAMLWVDGNFYHNYLPQQLQEVCKITNGMGFLNDTIHIMDKEITISKIHDLHTKLDYSFQEIKEFIEAFPELVFSDAWRRKNTRV